MSSKVRTATIPLYAGDDLEVVRRLFQDIQHAELVAEKSRRRQLSGTARMGEGEPGDGATAVERAQAAYDEFLPGAAERATEMIIRPIGSRRFRQLMADHPPRTEPDEEGRPVVVAEDDLWKVNTLTFPRKLLTYHDPSYVPLDSDDPHDVMRTLLAPTFSSTDRFDRFLDDELDDGEFDRLWQAAYFLNRNPGADPKASRSWSTRQTSSAT